MIGTATDRWRAKGLALLAAALVFTACVGGESTETTTAGTEGDGGATTTAAAEGEGTQAPDGELASLVISLDSDVNTLEPHTLRSTGAFAATGALYQGLLRERLEEDENGLLLSTKEFEPNLAADWSEDGAQVTFTIREGIQFADGDPIVAEDFQWTIQRALNSFLLAQLGLFGVDDPADVAAQNEQTLVLTPDRTGPVFEQLMSHQHGATALDAEEIQEHATEDDPWAFEWLADNATPNGPYVLESFDRDSQVVLAPNPNYWNPDALHNGGITIRFVPDGEQRALLVQRGELDFANGIPSRVLAELENDPNVLVYRAPSSRLHYMGLNTQIAPFDNVDVRRAISYAIPYQEIVDTTLFGFGNTAGGFISRNMITYAGDEIGTYETDLEMATQLLEQAGVEPFGIELAVRQSRAEEQDAAVLIQENLRQVGIDVEVAILPDGEFFERLNAKELPMWIHDWYQWGEDPFLLMSFLIESSAFTNYAQYFNPELDAIIAEGLGESDEGRRQELSRQAQEILLSDAPLVYLYNKDWHAVTGPGVTGVNKDMTEIPQLEWLANEGE